MIKYGVSLIDTFELKRAMEHLPYQASKPSLPLTYRSVTFLRLKHTTSQLTVGAQLTLTLPPDYHILSLHPNISL